MSVSERVRVDAGDDRGGGGIGGGGEQREILQQVGAGVGVHGIGGTLGAIVTGVFANKDINPNLVSEAYAKVNGLDKLVTEGGLVMNQLKACGITIALSVVATVVITLIVKVLVGLRPTEEVEATGLDLTEHGESGYEH